MSGKRTAPIEQVHVRKHPFQSSDPGFKVSFISVHFSLICTGTRPASHCLDDGFGMFRPAGAARQERRCLDDFDTWRGLGAGKHPRR